MHCRTADLMAFQTALVNQPAGREFGRTVRLRIAWHIRVLLQQIGHFFSADNRVFKETSDITKHIRIRQFTVADCTHCVGNIFGCCFSALAQFGNCCRQIAIAQVRHKMFFQRKYNRNNHITSFAFLFEQAFTIGKVTVGIGKLDKGFRIQIKAAYAMDNIFRFNAVCADVLYRRRADRARNQAQVFQPA